MTRKEIQDLLCGKAIIEQKAKNLYDECDFYKKKLCVVERYNYDEMIRDYKIIANNFLLFALDVLDINVACSDFHISDSNGKEISSKFTLKRFYWYGEDDEKPSRMVEVDCGEFRTNVFALYHFSLFSIVDFVYDILVRCVKGDVNHAESR